MLMFEPIPPTIPMNSIFEGGWSSLSKFHHLHFELLHKVIKSPHSYISNVQIFIASSFSSVNTHVALVSLIMPTIQMI
jgi:hypothetical protein